MKIQDFRVETDKFVEGKVTYTKKFRDKTELIVILSTCKSDRSNKKKSRPIEPAIHKKI